MNTNGPNPIERIAHAKVNLALAVGPADPESGMHPIHSWMHAIAIGDEVRVARSGYSSYRVCNPDGESMGWAIEDDLAVRAQKAIEAGDLKAETVPVTVKSRAGESTVEFDEQPGNANLDKIPKLRPAFKDDGTVTAANSSSISDGASALVLASEAAVNEHGLSPMAKILGHTTNSRHPSEFTIAPVGAIEKLLDKVGWSVADVDLFEINEAFAMVTMAAIRDLGLDPEKVNIFGGACAQGHPIGSTGSRIIVTLMYALQRLGKKRGVAALCIGGGEATAIAIELV